MSLWTFSTLYVNLWNCLPASVYLNTHETESDCVVVCIFVDVKNNCMYVCLESFPILAGWQPVSEFPGKWCFHLWHLTKNRQDALQLSLSFFFAVLLAVRSSSLYSEEELTFILHYICIIQVEAQTLCQNFFILYNVVFSSNFVLQLYIVINFFCIFYRKLCVIAENFENSLHFLICLQTIQPY